jgi:hypothetical protein
MAAVNGLKSKRSPQNEPDSKPIGVWEPELLTAFRPPGLSKLRSVPSCLRAFVPLLPIGPPQAGKSAIGNSSKGDHRAA